MDCTLFDVYELVGADMSLSLPKNVLNDLASLPYLILYFLLSGWYHCRLYNHHKATSFIVVVYDLWSFYKSTFYSGSFGPLGFE